MPARPTALVVAVLVAAVAVTAASAAARADDVTVHVELDPLPFANGGYGAQVGLRHPALAGVRLAVASFSLHVPDPIAQLGGNDGFDLRVRPSAALYALYYRAAPGHDGLALGVSLRYLRVRYQHDDAAGGQVEVCEVSPEAIVGYQWHPWRNGFYLQPWLALGVTVHRDRAARVGGHTYAPLPVSPFATVNLGWERRL